MSVLVTFIPVIATKKKAVEIVETTRAGEDGKDSESGEYLENLIQILCILYPIIFWRKFIHVLVLLNSDSEVITIHPTFT